jgi:Raf kinase inhibitor-like YbhB/YbcL family protein
MHASHSSLLNTAKSADSKNISTQDRKAKVWIGGLSACALAIASILLSGCGGTDAHASTPVFTLSSPDLASGTFDTKFILNGFGCKGLNISPALQWSNVPAGTQSFDLQVQDIDAETGGGLWHWSVYNIPATVTRLAQGAGNLAATLPVPATGGLNDFYNTGVTGGNNNYGGPCPPVGDKPHRYVFTLYAVGVPNLEAAAGIPVTATTGLHSLVLNRLLGSSLLGTASFTATYGQ